MCRTPHAARRMPMPHAHAACRPMPIRMPMSHAACARGACGPHSRAKRSACNHAHAIRARAALEDEDERRREKPEAHGARHAQIGRHDDVAEHEHKLRPGERPPRGEQLADEEEEGDRAEHASEEHLWACMHARGGR